MEHTKTSLWKTTVNLYTLRTGLDSLIRKNENKEIIKPAGKGSIFVIMSPDYY